MRYAALTSLMLLAAVTTVSAQRPPMTGPAGGAAPSPYDRDALYPTPVKLYGRVNVGVRKRDATPQRIDADPCAASSATGSTGWAVDGVERSRVGLLGTEVLDRGLMAHLQLEQSFDPDTGALRGPCGLAFDARATVGLSDRSWGRIDLGRTDQPAWLLSQRIDPWSGSGTASPDWRTYVAPERGATRSSGAVTYTSRDESPWRVALQVGRPLLSQPDRHDSGVSLAYDRLPWLVGAGYQRWPGASWAQPMVVAHDSGTRRLAAAFTTGRFQGTDYRNLFIGWSAPEMAKGDPARLEWRAGVNLHHVDGGRVGDWQSHTKFGLGGRYRLSHHAWFAWGGAWVKPRAGSGHAAADVSLTYAFERNLRVPQWPR